MSAEPNGGGGRDHGALLQTLTALEVDYWHEVDLHNGREGHGFYVPDGVFVIGETRMQGHEAVRGFYAWREARGARTARHVVTNFRIDHAREDEATLRCILLLYAADGEPVLPSLPAIMIADVKSICVRRDGRWLYRSHVLTPVFMGGVAPTIPPAAEP